ncbi:hypothetical protein KP509_18G056400 [Ceratopteris richardii]|uniref:Nodulin-like domain-containing protein n=1 Tax=Ceratopteris richardii TaxID=49495 RepID=A0A8T2SRS4_CERRI|nr:hypothetical protein KP509_18G056400 [Ceratopteris richardii]
MEKLIAGRQIARQGPRLAAMLRSPWMVVAVSVLVQCFTGGSYNFSIYSQSIKESLQLTQEQLDSISVAKDIGANVGVISGFIYDFFPTWMVLAFAAILSLVGNLMIWLSITYRVPSPPLWLVCIYAFLASNSQTFSNTAVVVTCVKIFPVSRGTIVGLMKGCLGLSGAILVQFYLTMFGNNEQSFPLMMACLGPFICVAGMFFIQPVRPIVSREEKSSINLCSIIILSLSAYLFAVIVLESFTSPGRSLRIAIVCGILVILICPLGLVAKSEQNGNSSNETSEPERNDYLPLPEEPQAQEEPHEICSSLDNSGKSKELEMPDRGGGISLLQAFLSLDFWLLFVASACGMGSGLTIINNMSQLGLSLGYNTNEISTFVSLWSIWNFLGRFGAGHISELFFQSKGLSRPLFIIITLGIMVFGHICIAIGFPNALYVGPILVGTCYGAQWSLMPTISSELFGLKSFGAIFNTIAIASPISSYILSVKVTGYIYDMEAKKEHHGLSKSSSCSGVHCFRLSLLIMAGVCAFGSVLSVFLFLRTRRFYSRLRQSIS